MHSQPLERDLILLAFPSVPALLSCITLTLYNLIILRTQVVRDRSHNFPWICLVPGITEPNSNCGSSQRSHYNCIVYIDQRPSPPTFFPNLDSSLANVIAWEWEDWMNIYPPSLKHNTHILNIVQVTALYGGSSKSMFNESQFTEKNSFQFKTLIICKRSRNKMKTLKNDSPILSALL